MRKQTAGSVILLLACALFTGSCAPLQPPSATGPHGNEPPYPVLFTDDSHRTEAALAAVTRLTQATTSQTIERLQPITATIESLPPNPATPLYLPKVGAAAVMNEEETRESLRRFIRDWRDVIGSEPAKLSLVERLDQPDGSKVANYEQRPFRYPIRGNYGKFQIRFATDRHVLNMISTCIPDADRIQTALAAITVRLKAEDAIKQLKESEIKYTDPQGNKLSFRAPAASDINPRELVVYILPSKDRPDALEFHLAWEIPLTNAPVKTVYLDAVNGEIIAT
ncbi:MAG TPA: hypothetical protein DCK99_17830 [Blastocatellia bacterium]|jgi:hypothetical protein|nr:hypothetical protein [Blastocatellia bacterium]